MNANFELSSCRDCRLFIQHYRSYELWFALQCLLTSLQNVTVGKFYGESEEYNGLKVLLMISRVLQKLHLNFMGGMTAKREILRRFNWDVSQGNASTYFNLMNCLPWVIISVWFEGLRFMFYINFVKWRMYWLIQAFIMFITCFVLFLIALCIYVQFTC